jgi:hypothetical protein
MSYSFMVRAATASAALVLVSDKLAELVENQPVHQNDAAKHETVAALIVSLLHEDETMDVSVSVSGWLSWGNDLTQTKFTGANVAVTANHVKRET